MCASLLLAGAAFAADGGEACDGAEVEPTRADVGAPAGAAFDDASLRIRPPTGLARELRAPIPAADEGRIEPCRHTAFHGSTRRDLETTTATSYDARAWTAARAGAAFPAGSAELPWEDAAPEVTYDVDLLNLGVGVSAGAQPPAVRVDGEPGREPPLEGTDATGTRTGPAVPSGDPRGAAPSPAAARPTDAEDGANGSTAGSAFHAAGAPGVNAADTAAAAVGLLAVVALALRVAALASARRRALLGQVRARPGLTVADAARFLGVTRQAAEKHLWKLERAGLVHARTEGRWRLHFASAPEARAAKAHAALQSPSARRVLDTFLRLPGASQLTAAEALGMPISTVRWHVARLVAAGLLEERRCRGIEIYPAGASRWHSFPG